VTEIAAEHRRGTTDGEHGIAFCCAGSTIGLMAMLVALDVMSLFWMSVIAVLACAQKLLPAKAAIDVPLALALIGLGFVIVIEPSLISGLTQPAM
jgi:predicted metal-binding membrane protein